jgi:hypothetical protein
MIAMAQALFDQAEAQPRLLHRAGHRLYGCNRGRPDVNQFTRWLRAAPVDNDLSPNLWAAELIVV